MNTSMKTSMKFFAAITIMSTFAIGAMAQSTDNTTIKGKAEVLQGINVTGLTALDFGNVSPSLSKTIDLVNGATGGQAGVATGTTGVFSVSAAPGSNVQIQFTTLPGVLKTVAGDELTINTYTAGYGIALPFAGSTFDPGTGTQVESGNFPTKTIGSENAIYVFIGGKVSPGPTQVSGSYSADIALTATYN